MGLAVSWYTTWFSTLCQRSFPFRCFPLAGSAPFLAPVRWSTPAVEPCCWVGDVLIHHLVFYLVPAQLPLPLLTLIGCCNLSGSSLLVYSAVVPCCWVGGVFAASLGFLPCAVLFLRGLQLAQLPCCRFPWGFSGHRVSVLLLPFFFCASPAPTGLQGLAGFCTLCQGAPVGVVSALWSAVSSPCCLSLTLGWVSFWTAVSPVSVGCEVCGLDCPSWFVHLFMSLFVLHLLWGWGGLVTGL